MSRYSLIDLPIYVQQELYEINVSAVASALMNHGKVESVYRIGSVSAPGISDLDMLVIFKDGTTTTHDPLKKLDEKGHYLFVHRLFGTSVTQFQQVLRVTQYHNYRLIGGSESRLDFISNPEDVSFLKTQTALEFMLKMFMVMNTQKAYRIIKVRAFLLEARALEYDLDYLGVKSGELFDVIQEIIELRKKWFLGTQSSEKICDLFDRLFLHLKTFLSEILVKEKFYTPGVNVGRFARNVRWSLGSTLTVSKKGVPLPAFFASAFHRKYFNMMNKVTYFSLKFPLNINPPSILKQRFALFNEMAAYNKKHIPHFIPPASGLRIDQ